MKFKPMYMYLIIIVTIVIALFLLSGEAVTPSVNVVEDNTKKIPDDKIHSGMQSGVEAPGKSNVSKDFSLKLEALKKSIENNPNDTMKVREYADILGMAHKGAQAIKLYGSILSIDSSRIDLYHKLTFLYFADGNFGKAEAATNKVLKLEPENLEAKYNSGAISAAKGNLAEAKIIWTEVLENYPGTRAAEFAGQSLARMEQ